MFHRCGSSASSGSLVDGVCQPFNYVAPVGAHQRAGSVAASRACGQGRPEHRIADKAPGGSSPVPQVSFSLWSCQSSSRYRDPSQIGTDRRSPDLQANLASLSTLLRMLRGLKEFVLVGVTSADAPSTVDVLAKLSPGERAIRFPHLTGLLAYLHHSTQVVRFTREQMRWTRSSVDEVG